MTETAYVQAIYSRRKHVGYGVYTKNKDGGFERCLSVYRIDTKNATAQTLEVALHLANTQRDDFNAGVQAA